MCLSVFPCMSIACSNSLMHALCAAVTTSFCPRHPALRIWPIVSFGSSPFQLLPFSSCAFLHNVHSAYEPHGSSNEASSNEVNEDVEGDLRGGTSIMSGGGSTLSLGICIPRLDG